jgi:microcystin degradation protein MlrC
MALPVNVVFLSLQGTKVAQGCDDCEEGPLRRFLTLAGTDGIITVEASDPRAREAVMKDTRHH